MNDRRLQTYFFIIVLVASIVLTLVMFGTYLRLLAFGGVLAVAVRPVYRWFLKIFRSEQAAAFVTVICSALVILIPLVVFAGSLYLEASDIISGVSGRLTDGILSETMANIVPASLLPQVTALLSDSQSVAKAVASYLTSSLPSIFSNFMAVALGFFIVLFSTYYLLKDARKLKAAVIALSPLTDENDESVIDRVLKTVVAVMNGVVVIALVKAVLAAVFFWVFGVPQPFFWGAVTGFASILPIIGSGLVAVPAVAYLLLTGHLAAAVGLAIVSMAIIGTVDNFLQPKLVESKTNIHPLLVLVAVLGGFRFYGFAGFVLGPLTLAVALALIDIYKKDFRRAFVEEKTE
jgi:predicted PurR-regulated permease PerM